MSADAQPPETLPTDLLQAARAGSPEALGQLFEAQRNYLLAVSNGTLPGMLCGKLGASDVVQETFLTAQRRFGEFRGSSIEELRAWLRGVLQFKVAEWTRHYCGTEMRAVSRETQLPGPSGETSSAVVPEPAAEGPTPSQHAARAEDAEALRSALDRLPEQYRQVILWRQWDELPFEEIATRLGKSVDAARMTWWRALERLQSELDEPG